MQKLYEERSGRAARGEQVINSNLVDLFAKKDGRVTEVYEVKTGVGLQMLYTAICSPTSCGLERVRRSNVMSSLQTLAEELPRPDIRPKYARRFRLAKNANPSQIGQEGGLA